MGNKAFLTTDIEVVLPAYLYLEYLPEQIDSIFNQTIRPKRLLLRHDGYNTEFTELSRRLKTKYGSWLKLVDSSRRLGFVNSFGFLLHQTTAEYIALSDQDDIWIRTKLADSIELLKLNEALYGQNIPILVHTDLIVTDQNLNIMNRSFVSSQGNSIEAVDIDTLLWHNCVTGCTILCNRSLLKRAIPFPAEAVAHDWWMALVAYKFGKIAFLNTKTVKYRQHGHNTIGFGGSIRHKTVAVILDPIESWRSALRSLERAFHQHIRFSMIYDGVVNPIFTLLELGRLLRLKKYLQNRDLYSFPHKQDAVRRIAFTVIFILLPRLKRI